MHITIRRYRIHAGLTQDLLERIRTNFLPVISKLPKFVAYYAVDEGDGDISAISIFQDEAGAQASNAIAADWVLRNVASMISVPPQIIAGEVVASAEG
jgi:hypothetical protein